uniref:siderophore-interacting protein n=1 Tax=Microbacterium sp. 18062 TaxID=2681410 RepID=UPI0027D31A3E
MRRIRDITPRMRRITLSGAELDAFESAAGSHPEFAAPGFDDHVKLIFASDGDIAGAVPRQLTHGIEWGPSETRLGRDYTPRRIERTDAGIELDLDFVLHGEGPAASWAGAAVPGDPLWFVGPKSSTVLPDGLDWVLLAGDETALPAIGRYLDERPSEAPVRVVVLVEDAAAKQQLALRAGDRVEWI